MPPDRLRALLADLRERLAALYGERLVRLVLYGSHARGEATEDSDVDVLVVLRGASHPFREIERMSASVFETELEHRALVSALPVSAADYEAGQSPLLRNVRAEGVVL